MYICRYNGCRYCAATSLRVHLLPLHAALSVLAESVFATRNDIDSALDPAAATTLSSLLERLAVLDGLDDQAWRLQNRRPRHVPAANVNKVMVQQSLECQPRVR